MSLDRLSPSKELIELVKRRLQPNTSPEGDPLWKQFVAQSCKDESVLNIHKLAAEGNIDALERELDSNSQLCLNEDGNGLLPLHWAAACGEIRCLDLLLRPEYAERYSDRLIHSAFLLTAENGHLESAKRFLFPSRVDVLLRNECGDAAVHFASRFGRTCFVEFLLTRMKVPIDYPTFFGKFTPLHEAARHSRSSVVEFLLRQNADPDVTCQIGRTSLMMCAERGDRASRDCVKNLLKYGASHLARDKRGRSVFDVATATNSLTLLYHGAIPLTTNDAKKMDQKINLDLIEQNRKILVADVKSGSIPVTSNDDLLQLAHRRLLELQQKKFKDDDGVLLTWTAEVVHHVSKNFVSIGQSRCVINRSEDQILLKYIQCVTERQQSGQDKLETVFVYVTDDGRIDLAGSIGIPSAIRAQGPEAIRAYRRALENGCVREYRVQVMLVGQFGSGKTSLKDSLLDRTFIDDKLSTVGLECDGEEFAIDRSSVANWRKVDGVEDRYDSSTQLAKIIHETMFDKDVVDENMGDSGVSSRTSSIGSRKSLSGTKRRSSNVSSSSSLSTSKTSSPLLSKKVSFADGEASVVDRQLDRTLPPDVARKLADFINGMKAKRESDHVTVTLTDFGGQKIFYSSHLLFLSPQAIYLLVFRLDEDLRDPAFERFRYGTSPDDVIESKESSDRRIDYIEFWGNSIRSLAVDDDDDGEMYSSPPIVLVGTRKDKLPVPEKERDDEARHRMEHAYEALAGKSFEKHITGTGFAIDNTRSGSDKGGDPEADRLRAHIEKVARGLPHVGTLIPVAWLKFEEYVRLSVADGKVYMSLDEARRNAINYCDVSSTESEFRTMMSFLHRQGVLVNFTDVESLADLVILNRQWLVDVVKQIITALPKLGDDAGRLRDKWRHFKNGYLHERLLRHMLQKNGVCTKDFLERHYKTLVEILLRFDLICPCVDPSDDDGTFVSPDVRRKEAEVTRRKGDDGSRSSRRYKDDDLLASLLQKGTQKRCYLIPAMLRPKPENGQVFYTPRLTDTEPLFYIFSFLPEGAFFRLISRCSFRFPGQSTVYRYSCKFKLNSELSLFVFLVESTVKIVVQHYREDRAPGADSCVEAREFIESMLSDLSSQPGLPRLFYRRGVKCQAKRQRKPSCARHGNCDEAKCVHYVCVPDDDDDDDEALHCRSCDGRMERSTRLKLWFGQEDKAAANCCVSTNEENSIEDDAENYRQWFKNSTSLNAAKYSVLEAVVERMDVPLPVAADWRSLAGKLGFTVGDVQKVDTEASRGGSPTRIVLTQWSTCKEATIGKLLESLYDLKRLDALQSAIDALERTSS